MELESLRLHIHILVSPGEDWLGGESYRKPSSNSMLEDEGREIAKPGGGKRQKSSVMIKKGDKLPEE